MSAYSDKVIADGAIAYWRLGETSGTIARSEVGSFDGTISGGVTLNQPGALTDGNKAMAFDGATGKIISATSPAIPVTATFEAWVTFVSDGSDQPIYSAGSGERPLFNLAVGGQVSFYDAGPNISVASQSMLSAGICHHIACVLTGTKARFYIDGTLDVERDYVRPNPSVASTGQIGNDPAYGAAASGFFKGLIDDLAIYPTALTPAQIAAHYAEGTGKAAIARRRRRLRAHAV